MLEYLNKEDLKEMFLYIAGKIIENEAYLTEIDSKIGDGDHGIGMAHGFSHVRKELPHADIHNPKDVFLAVGNQLLDTMGGASGVLFGTLFISGIVNQNLGECLCLNDLADIFWDSLCALKQRGKAQIGDKTMIDALEPAVLMLKSCAEKGKDIKEGFRRAAEEAKKGVEYTKQITAKFGRAKYYKENSLGMQDAGAASVSIIFQAMADWAAQYEIKKKVGGV